MKFINAPSRKLSSLINVGDMTAWSRRLCERKFVVMVMQQQQRPSQLNEIMITRIKISIIITINHIRNGKDKNVFVQKIGGGAGVCVKGQSSPFA
jgi:hypothetical protein